jgi:hypothetical protein
MLYEISFRLTATNETPILTKKEWETSTSNKGGIKIHFKNGSSKWISKDSINSYNPIKMGNNLIIALDGDYDEVKAINSMLVCLRDISINRINSIELDIEKYNKWIYNLNK